MTKKSLDKIVFCKYFWKLILIHPLTGLITIVLLVSFIALGVYYDWNAKVMIEKSFGYILTALIVGMLEYLILEKRRK